MRKTKRNAFKEGILPKYEILGTIIQDNDGFNIMDNNKQKMLLKSYPSLKQLLSDIANNL